MNIEINGETEQLIHAARASGKYASAEEFVAAMAKQELKPNPNGERLDELPERIDVDALAAQQGVKPFRADEPLSADIWPEDESTDEFLRFLRESRTEAPNSGATR